MVQQANTSKHCLHQEGIILLWERGLLLALVKFQNVFLLKTKTGYHLLRSGGNYGCTTEEEALWTSMQRAEIG